MRKDLIPKPIPKLAISLWALIAGVEGIFATILLVREPSEVESVIAFGLSTQRLLIVGFVLLGSLLFVSIAILHYYQSVSWIEALSQNINTVRYITTGAFIFEIIVLHLLLMLPEYRFLTLSGYLARLRPALIWFALIFAQTFILGAAFGFLSLKSLRLWQNAVPVILVISFVGISWGLIAITKIGIVPDDFYWNMTGVPIMTWQVWAVVGATVFGWFSYKFLISGKEVIHRSGSKAVFIFIWVVAALIWIRTPLAPTFNAPGPYPPERTFYPFVDAALYDLGAQSAIYGRGFFFGTFLDRGLLSGFLTLIHLIFGQNYLVVVGVQAAVYAVFPAILYLVGKKLHSKSVGVMVAGLAVFKVSNAIAGGKFFSTSHPKLLLTEFPTGMVLALFSLFMINWLKEDGKKVSYLAGVGASIGIGILLRQNVFFMVLVLIAMGVSVWKLDLTRAFRDVLLVVTAFFITISPWMWRNQRIAGEPFFFLPHFENVIQQRYDPQSHLEQNRLVSLPASRALKISTTTAKIENNDIFEQYQFIPKHFVHNIITSVLILPPSPVWDDLRHVVDNYPYWGRIPDMQPGQISSSIGIFLAVNLIILSIGLGSAWKRVRFAALVPLMVFLFYNLANAFARTSGGRYIVPVDWVVYFYYAIGLVEIIRFCMSMLGFRAGDFFDGVSNPAHNGTYVKLDWGRASIMVLPFFLMVAALPSIEFFSPGDTTETPEALVQQIDALEFFETSNISLQQMKEFLNTPNAVLISGRGFYPRYYPHGQGEPIFPGQITVYTARDYPRLVFTLLLPNTDKPVLLPIDEPRLHFPDAAKVIVMGCQVGQRTALKSYFNYIDAAFVVILDETEMIYTRIPEAPLSCPLREPVCDNNRNCN